ncbi:MAG: AsnC family transcriptional regulator [Halobacteriales archaeon]|nr:AsnC family transcriptional regulator [Halobacteriales archaeon]
MTTLDGTDAEILRLLVEDARRPYSDIAESVDLSAPAVRDRIDRLREVGLIRRFTVDVDRSQLRAGVPVLVDVGVAPSDVERVRAALVAADGVEHVFTTADAHVVFQASVPDGDVGALLEERVGLEAVRDYDVELLTSVEWAPQVAGTDFALECAECGNTVTAEGESSTLEGSRYHFCCGSCQERFVSRFDELAAGAG